MNTMTSQDVYIKLTDPTGRHADTISHHRVWDVDRFISTQVEMHSGKKAKPEDIRRVSAITRDEYLAYRRGQA